MIAAAPSSSSAADQADRAAAGLRQRLVLVAVDAQLGGEVVPERDVLGLFVGVHLRSPGGARERDHGVPVLAGVAGQVVARQLALLPARVERMLEHVPALPSRVNPCNHIHLGSLPSTDPYPPILSRQGDAT